MAVDQKWARERAAEVAIIQQQHAAEATRRAEAGKQHTDFLSRVTAYHEGQVQVQFDPATAPRLTGIFTALDAQHLEAQAQRRREQAQLHRENPAYYLAGMPLPSSSQFLAAATDRVVNKDFYDEKGNRRT